MSSILLQNTIIPIQVILHHCSHALPQTVIPIQLTLLACIITHMFHHRVFQKLLFSQQLWWLWACFNILIPSHWIEVDIERLLLSLAVKMANFWGLKIHKKVINSSTKCLISVKIAILTPHILPPPLVNIWLMFDLQKYVKWLCMFLEVHPCFQKAHVFGMDLQPAADPYNVVCSFVCFGSLISI